MKRFLALFLVVLLGLTALTGCGGETTPEGETSGEDLSLQKVLDQGVITCAVSPDYAPYEYLDLVTNEVKGSDIVLAQYIADQLGVDLKIEQMSFETCLAAAQTGSVDMCISSLSWKPERAEVMALSDHPGQGRRSSAVPDGSGLHRKEGRSTERYYTDGNDHAADPGSGSGSDFSDERRCPPVDGRKGGRCGLSGGRGPVLRG